MAESVESHDKNRVGQKTEERLGRWECLVIKCFAILFLILFLSEKAVGGVGSIRRAWVAQVVAPLDTANRSAEHCGCPGAGEDALKLAHSNARRLSDLVELAIAWFKYLDSHQR